MELNIVEPIPDYISDIESNHPTSNIDEYSEDSFYDDFYDDFYDEYDTFSLSSTEDEQIIEGVVDCVDCKQEWQSYIPSVSLIDYLKNIFKPNSLNPNEPEVKTECECYYEWRNEIKYEIEENEELKEETDKTKQFESALNYIPIVSILKYLYGTNILTS